MAERFEKFIFKITDKIENNCAFGAVRQGLIMLIPLLTVAYMALMLVSLPIPVYQEFLTELLNGKVVELLQFFHKGVNEFLAVILAMTTSISYALIKRKTTGQYVGSGDVIVSAIITLAALAGLSGIQYEDFSVGTLSNLNTFTALFVSLVSSKLFFTIRNMKFLSGKKQGTNTDSLYAEAVAGIWSAVIILGFFSIFYQILRAGCGVNSIQELMEMGVNRFLASFDNGLGAGISVLLVTHIMWFFGIHGNHVLDAVIKQNYTAIDVGIYSKTFQDIFAIMGGCGSTLCLVIAILLFSKKKSIRNIAKMSTPTVLFNINEIIVFGIPVILNPIFFIPYMLVPVVNCVISYGAIYFGLVPHVERVVEWTTPVLLSGYQATGSLRGAVLQMLCITIGVFVYKPFLRMFEIQSEKRLLEDVSKLVKVVQEAEEKNQIIILTSRDDELGSVARLLATDLEEAVAEKKLFLLYQPQIDCNGKCIGAEALLRWKHPIAGFIYPPLIIRLAKERKILHKIEEFLFDEAAGAIEELDKKLSSDFKVSVNITNESLEWDGIEKCIDESVKRHRISSEKLWLEITEQDALSSSFDIVEKLNYLKTKGHKFLIDDFGMGHTSLMYLQTNYFDVVKLDKALTKDILDNKRNSDIIGSIVYLGQSLHFTTVAEYVETQEQRDELERLGCDAFQGYLYSKPITLDELIPWMQKHEGDEG